MDIQAGQWGSCEYREELFNSVNLNLILNIEARKFWLWGEVSGELIAEKVTENGGMNCAAED